MRPERPIARRLRKQGWSYNGIARSLRVPKSTLATWFFDLTLSPALVNRLYSRARSAGTRALVARNKRQTVLAEERARHVQAMACREIRPMDLESLRLVGTALYWAEGAKRFSGPGGRRAAFSNADPIAIALMMRFFREVCAVPEEKFRAQLSVAPGLSMAQAVRFWSSLTRISPTRFSTYQKLSRASRQQRPRFRLPHGTLQIRVSDTALVHHLLGWIQGLQVWARHG